MTRHTEWRLTCLYRVQWLGQMGAPRLRPRYGRVELVNGPADWCGRTIVRSSSRPRQYSRSPSPPSILHWKLANNRPSVLSAESNLFKKRWRVPHWASPHATYTSYFDYCFPSIVRNQINLKKLCHEFKVPWVEKPKINSVSVVGMLLSNDYGKTGWMEVDKILNLSKIWQDKDKKLVKWPW